MLGGRTEVAKMEASEPGNKRTNSNYEADRRTRCLSLAAKQLVDLDQYGP